MSARKMTAGLAGSSKSIRLNGNVGGGDKLQGTAPSVGKMHNINYGSSYGNNRNVVFYVNQLGGVGKGRSMFIAGADGVRRHSYPVNNLYGSGKDSSGGILLLTLGGSTTGNYSDNGGSRMFLVEFDNQDSFTTPETVTSTSYLLTSQGEYVFNPYTDINTQYNYNSSKISRSASNSSNLKYVTLDCSNEVTITNIVNVSLTRPGIVTTSYLVPANTAVPVQGNLSDGGISGNIYNNGKTFSALINQLQDGSGNITPDLIAQYGLGYNDAQGVATGYSNEIDLFEMTPCSLATTLHGAIKDGSSITTDTDGAWCNIHGTYGYTTYTGTIGHSGAKFPAGVGPNQDTSINYISYTFTIDDADTQVNTVNKYGPGPEFYINTLKNIKITNTIIGFASNKMSLIWATATGNPEASYNADDGWMQMTTKVEQTSDKGKEIIMTMTILSQGFTANTGVAQMNYVTSVWTDGSLEWLDGKIDNENVPRGWVTYGNVVATADETLKIISDDVYNNLNPAYKSGVGYATVMPSSSLNPSISLLGGLSISSMGADKSYGYTLDIMYRGIDDAVFPNVNWSGQYALTYGVHYTNAVSINDFDMTSLVNVPPILNGDNGNNLIGDNPINIAYDTYIKHDIWNSEDIDPGSFLTGNSVSNPGVFAIPANQLVYSPLSSNMNNNYLNNPDVLKTIMPADGANYLSFSRS
jgi:hypothetical protein